MPNLLSQLVRKESRFHLTVFALLFFLLIMLPIAVLGMNVSSTPPESIILGESFPPSFSKTFIPNIIGPGSVSTLRFNIVNDSPSPAEELAFTDNLPTGSIPQGNSPTGGLPSGVVIATPANVKNSCRGTITAPDGGNTISLAGGDVAGGSSCFIEVDVTSFLLGTYTNVTGGLTSTSGNSGTAAANLTVASDRPGFSKSFAPSSVDLGGRSTLTFTIDNTLNQNASISMSFTDDLPTGMEIADPANASTTCGTDLFGPTLTAVSGTDTISFSYYSNNPSFPAVAAGATCTVSVDVIATGAGLLVNSSGELISSYQSTVSSGKANAALNVAQNSLYLTKSFTTDPVAAGRTTSLQFTIENQNRLSDATNIAFTDDLNATLSGLVATGLPISNVCGAGSQLSGTSIISLTGGQLAGSSSCTFTVTLQLPTSPQRGNFPNTTTAVTANVGGSPVVGSSGSDTLFVAPVPDFTKQFIDDPVPAGGDVTLRFNIANSSLTSAITGTAFIDDLTAYLPFPVTAVLPATPCGAGSNIALISLGIEMQGLSLTDGNLPVGESCEFDVILTIPSGMPSGSFVNTTTNITGYVDGQPLEGHAATDTLEVVSAPKLRKSFVDDPVLPGDDVLLEFTIEQGSEEPLAATNIAFTDNLSDTLPGLVATGLPQTDVCGAGSQITGSDNLTFAGGSLSPGQSCTFTVTLQVPGGDILPNSYPNTTSNVTASVSGLAVTGLPGQDDLLIGGVDFTKSFTDDPVVPGDTVDLEFAIINESSTLTVTNLSFTDSLSSVLAGLTTSGPLPTEPCGAGSSLTGTTILTFAGGTLGPGESCTFSVTLQVPANADNNTYTNVTSSLTGLMDGSPFAIDPATDTLVVSSDLMTISKEFVGSPLLPGDTVILRFVLNNIHATDTVTDIEFVDDLTAVLPNLEAITWPTNPCGAGSQITGTDVLTFSGGQLNGGESCTFDVILQIPNSVQVGDRFRNVTSEMTGMSNGLPVTGGIAQDTLVIGISPVMLPIVLNNAVFAPDLIVTSVVVNGGNIQIEITNQGTTPVVDEFWVDLYVNPTTPPTMVNQTWELVGNFGAVWGVEGAAIPIDVGETLTLTLNDAYYRSSLSNLPGSIGSGDVVYVQVDSAAQGSTFGNVLETHEITNNAYNNIWDSTAIPPARE